MNFNIGIDIGTRNVRMAVEGYGVAFTASAAVAVRKGVDMPIAMGDEALARAWPPERGLRSGVSHSFRHLRKRGAVGPVVSCPVRARPAALPICAKFMCWQAVRVGLRARTAMR